MKTTLTLLSAMLVLLSVAARAEEHTSRDRLAQDTASAQAAPSGAAQATAHVVTVLVPTLEDASARAMVIRRPTRPDNLILITPETTPREFLNALRALNRSRRDVGEQAPDELRASIPAASPRQRSEPGAVASAAAHLSRVKTAATRAIEGLGSYPALTTSLPGLQP